MDINSIRDRAQGVDDDPVSEQELEFARQILRSGDGDVGAALYVVGYCGTEPDAALIEPYLRDDVHGGLALKALCRYLGLIDRYRSAVRKCILSDADIGFSGSRMAAVHLAPVYLRGFRDKEVEKKLLAMLCDFKDSNRSSARHALVRALGLHGALRDPLGLEIWPDPDASTIIAAACRASSLDRRDFITDLSN
ncbi:hypothetical protein M728_001458 [Ensifer sp. WSM1721]|uniref:hypothetical protein n=1 Tax=Ensifer sp. WSM1721 TaxID=1041159 RepID=UPI000479FC5C|nr:hypothetical protein [Ensifer sp. WSM1721]